MIPAKRQERIIEILKCTDSAAFSEIAEQLNCSQMTVRRDIEILASKNLVIPSHGGATINQELKKEHAYDARVLKDIDVKKKIAEAASKLVKSGDTLMIDAGTTTFYLAEFIKHIENLTVVTPDLRIALELSRANVKTFIPGGEIQNETGCVMSGSASGFIQRMSVDIAFIGISSVSQQFVMHTPTFEKSEFKRYFIENSNTAVLLADSSKFGRQSFFKVGSINMLSHIITDKEFSDEELKTIRSINEKDDFIIKTNGGN